MRSERFTYVGWEVDGRSLTCRYDLDGLPFAERISVDAPGWDSPAAGEACRLVFLLAGISYYKAGAPPVIDLGATPMRPGDADLLADFYVSGLGEYAYRNDLDLSGLQLTGGGDAGPPAPYRADPGRPLIPFGGGIDSIVTVEAVRAAADPTLFVLSREGDRYAAIEDAAAVAGLPIARAGRTLDPKILESRQRGWLNGHVPVTGVLSAIALLVAVLGGHDAVVMSNEWSASVGTTVEGGREVNHQWSKGATFESGLADLLARSYTVAPSYSSLLRPYSELWVARRFAALERYHPVFRSCNRAFHVDPAARMDRWCGHCDKCCFIDLILAPWMARERLAAVFDGSEPLDDPSLAPTFEALVGRGAAKPFECVGDAGECAAAAALAAARPDRTGNRTLSALAGDVAPAEVERLLRPLGPATTPERYARADLLV